MLSELLLVRLRLDTHEACLYVAQVPDWARAGNRDQVNSTTDRPDHLLSIIWFAMRESTTGDDGLIFEGNCDGTVVWCMLVWQILHVAINLFTLSRLFAKLFGCECVQDGGGFSQTYTKFNNHRDPDYWFVLCLVSAKHVLFCLLFVFVSARYWKGPMNFFLWLVCVMSSFCFALLLQFRLTLFLLPYRQKCTASKCCAKFEKQGCQWSKL